jgi:hypothetical protein
MSFVATSSADAAGPGSRRRRQYSGPAVASAMVAPARADGRNEPHGCAVRLRCTSSGDRARICDAGDDAFADRAAKTAIIIAT